MMTLQTITEKHPEDFAWLAQHGQFDPEDWDMESAEWEIESESRDAGGSIAYACPSARVTLSQSQPIIEVF